MRSSYSVLVNLNRETLHKFYIHYTLSTKIKTPDLFKNNNVQKFVTLKIDRNPKKFKVQNYFTQCSTFIF